MSCRDQWCPDCADRMIHQTNRGSRESSSALGQFVHDTLPHGAWSYMDVDGVAVRASTRGTPGPDVIRVFEHKWTDSRGIGFGQERLLRHFARMFNADPLIAPTSGVFVVRTGRNDPEFSRAEVTQLGPDRFGDRSGTLNNDRLRRLIVP